MQLTQDIQAKLIGFVHRAIRPGEALLLARLIADRIPVVGVVCEKPWEQCLLHRAKVDEVIFTLNDYMHISQASRESIYAMVERIWVWRQSVASGQSNLIFTGAQENVLDDFSGLMRSVNVDDMSPLADIALNANYMYDLFRQVVSGVWN